MATSSRPERGVKVGKLAAATGVTVRTLHYYEEIGLLVPCARSGGGHRLYSSADVERLYLISLLRRLGVPLAEIRRVLEDPAWSLRETMTRHLAELEQRLQATARLRGRLVELLSSLGSGDGPATHQLLDLMEAMTMLETTAQRRISYLPYADLEAACDYLVGVFGLGPAQVTRDQHGNATHVEVQAGDGVIWLHPEAPRFGLSSPRSAGAATAGTAVIVDDVDAHHRHAVEQGAAIEYEPVDQPYGYREYSARDSEGGLWSFLTPLD
jgi:MerR family transcriptional regulator, thiopeptide resistance regulator